MYIRNTPENMEKARKTLLDWSYGREISKAEWEFLGAYVMMLSTWTVRKWYPRKSYDERADALFAAYVKIFDRKIFNRAIAIEGYNANQCASLICWLAGHAAGDFFRHRDPKPDMDFGRVTAEISRSECAAPVENN